MAEKQGFEPWVPIGYNGFRDRPNRPLWHLSAGRGLIGGADADCNLTFFAVNATPECPFDGPLMPTVRTRDQSGVDFFHDGRACPSHPRALRRAPPIRRKYGRFVLPTTHEAPISLLLAERITPTVV